MHSTNLCPCLHRQKWRVYCKDRSAQWYYRLVATPVCPNIIAWPWLACKSQETVNAENKSKSSPSSFINSPLKPTIHEDSGHQPRLHFYEDSSFIYENETPLFVSNIKHSVEELSVYPQVIDQFEFRKNLVLQELEANKIPFDLMQSSDAEDW